MSAVTHVYLCVPSPIHNIYYMEKSLLVLNIWKEILLGDPSSPPPFFFHFEDSEVVNRTNPKSKNQTNQTNNNNQRIPKSVRTWIDRKESGPEMAGSWWRESWGEASCEEQSRVGRALDCTEPSTGSNPTVFWVKSKEVWLVAHGTVIF